MRISEIRKLVVHQLKTFFMMSNEEEHLLKEEIIYRAVCSTQRCLSDMGNKYYNSQKSTEKTGGVLYYIILL